MADVLVVDDYAVHRAAIRYFLRQRGHEVTEASDGAEALGLLRGRRPDLILLDLAMPKLDGFGLLTALRDMAMPPIPVIVTTARTEAGTLARARELGARAVLLKSQFSLAALADTVAQALRAAPAVAAMPPAPTTLSA